MSEIYVTKPVTPETFFSEARFIGEMKIWDSVRSDLIELLSKDSPT